MQVPANVEWLPAVTILGAGLLGGSALAWFGSRRRAATAAAQKEEKSEIIVRELDAKRDSLLVQLRDLEDTSSKESASELASRRYELELELARTLMEMDDATGAVREARAEAPAAPAPPQARGFAWGLGTAVVVGVMIFLLLKFADKKESPQAMPGGEMAAAEQQPMPANAEAAALQSRIAANPNDFDARVDLARVSLGANNLMEAFNQTKYVLERNPDHAPALSYQAIVRLAMGQTDEAEEMLGRATKLAPTFVDGWVNSAIVFANLGDTIRTENAMAKAIEVSPQNRKELEGLLTELRRQAEEAKAAGVPARTPQDDPHKGLSNQPAQAAATGQAPAGPAVSGILNVDPSIQAKVKSPAVVFLIAREPGVQSGPPLAVRRMEVKSFPAAFTLSSADSMMGSALPANIRIEARLDADGDVVTKSGDPVGVLDGVAAGTSNAKIVIR